MVAKKRKSKRLTTKRRVLIDKKKREAIKKQKKLLKTQKSKRTPPSVLRTDEEIKTLEEIKKGAEQRQKEFEERHKEKSNEDNSFKSYMKHVNSVIAQSDVIFQILDARDPLGSRNEEIECKICSAGKKLVLILNKIDLVPKHIVNEWHILLKNEFPTLIFHRDFNKAEIFSLLKNYCRSADGEMKITVGIVGYPNVGKSTFINKLMRSDDCCNTGKQAGITKTVHTLNLENNIKLLDTPGVVFNKNMTLSNVLRMAVDLDSVNVYSYTNELLELLDKIEVCVFYRIEEFKDTTEFLKLLAQRFKMVKKKGSLDTEEAAKKFLRDFASGKISFYSVPQKREADFLGESKICANSSFAFVFKS
ncbi:hypothetical protein EDEG_03807 [Edhazardia aedis USNM 41457]|uniref:CP-type G domain-containing protein n=1 Tax=Edhazardia aedis (strain USNM 41457) TaxID=1003232 RepID=J8ZPN8_EDHAE|nr:hypothetical protein EDEG_03807 [Edhazardia aedis USNM 41457]|eukprot:EJW01648.1 hypothetical protein EDEG_03807 [Edhazardia aedis USNM 41457]